MGSYAIWWTEADGPRYAGKLELGSRHLFLSGAGRGRVAHAVGDIEAVDFRRGELTLKLRAGRLLPAWTHREPSAKSPATSRDYGEPHLPDRLARQGHAEH
jgi:hypothetical protein